MESVAFYLFAGITLLSAMMVITLRNPVHAVFFLILTFFSAAALFVLRHAEFLAMMLVVVYVGAVAVLFLFVVMMLDIKTPALKPWFVPKMKEFLHAMAWFLAYVCVVAIVAGGFFLLGRELLDIESLVTASWVTGEYLLLTLTLLVGVAITEFVFRKFCRLSGQRVLKTFCRVIPMGFVVLLVLAVEACGVVWMWLELPEVVLMAPIPPEPVLSNTHALGQLIYTDYIYVFQAVGLILLVAMIGAIVLTIRRRPDVKRQNVSAQIARKPEDAVTLQHVKIGEGVSI